MAGRRLAEDAQERLQAIAAITDSRIDHLDVDDLLDELLVRVMGLLNADTAAVLLLDQASQQLVARAACGIEEEVRQGVRIAVGVGFAGSPLDFEQSCLHRAGDPGRNQLQEPGVVDAEVDISHPAHVQDAQQFRPSLQGHAEHLADALLPQDGVPHRGSIDPVEGHGAPLGGDPTGQLVQRSLMPGTPPTVPGVEFATRFVPAETGGVGGDWYDAFVLPSGALWVMVGDVAGHGLSAAVTMGRLRAALRAYTLEGKPPEDVLALADRKLQFFDPGQTATVLCALLDPPYDKATLASAGHPPPFLATPGIGGGYVEMPVSPLLGATDAHPTPVTIGLAPGSLLLAYTDGLIERRNEPLDIGFERLAAAVTADEPELVCRRVMNALVGHQKPSDDMVVIVLRRTPMAASADG